MQVNDLIYGFKVLRIEEIVEQKSIVYALEHVKSGAQLIWVKNDDVDKAFSIAFKTLPDDDTGVFHIIEHSVLCGSKKYTVKEPFLDLLKNSMATFLNAMTFADKTMYPVSSANEKDFTNLMGVYLDAVFFPRFYEMEEIFRQEGWHYEETDGEKPSIFTGVVLNEMRGVFSSPDSCFYEYFDKNFYPDTIYAKCSGGNPKSVPTLTYEKFLDSHKKYYHPDNSYICLYGDMDFESKLKYIDEEYLSKFTKTGNQINIELQKPLGDRTVVEKYEIKPGDSKDNKTYIGRGYYICNFDDIKTKTAINILMESLVKTNESPLKKAILDAKLGEDFIGYFVDDTIQNHILFRLKNTNPDLKEKFVTLLEETLQKIAKEGLDKESLESTFNHLEFEILENDKGYSPGVTTAIEVMSTWLYGGDPIRALRIQDILKELREGIQTGYFENLITERILSSSHKMTMVLEPDENLESERLAFEKKQMDEYESEIGEVGKAEWKVKIEKLNAFQNHEDTPEEKATLPRIHLDELNKIVPKYHVEILKDKNGNDIRYYDYPTNSISYYRSYFDITNLTDKQVQYLSILRNLLYVISTKKYSMFNFDNIKDSKLGGFSSYISSVYDNNHEYHLLFSINTKYLDRNYEVLKDIIEQGLYETLFDEKEIRNILVQRKAGLESDLVRNGTTYASKKATSYLTNDSYWNELFSGYSFYLFLKDIVDNFDDRKEELLQNLKDITKQIQKSYYMQSLVGPKESLDKIIENPIRYSKQKPELDNYKQIEHMKVSFGHKNPGAVCYNVSAFNFKDEGFEYSNKSIVLRKVVQLDYLWNHVRVKGGAYGTSMSFGKNGLVTLTSYRDPNLKNTYDVYSNIAEYLKNFNPTKEDMEGYIIGVFSGFQSPVKNRDIPSTEDYAFFAKRTNEDLQQIWDDCASTTAEDIRAFAPIFEKCFENASNATFGSGKMIEENLDLFDEVD